MIRILRFEDLQSLIHDTRECLPSRLTMYKTGLALNRRYIAARNFAIILVFAAVPNV